MKKMLKGSFWLYLLAVGYFTFFWHSAGWQGSYELKLNLVPFYWLLEPLWKKEAISWFQVIMNILLFMPLGFYMAKLFKFDKTTTILLAFTLSLSIELVQPFFGRISDIDDLMLNTLGGVLGYKLWQQLINSGVSYEMVDAVLVKVNDYFWHEHYQSTILQ
ncbi:MAG: VanZ family protein [Erysipelotrichaceae bacterium]|nr:VanZ family protein [Erysipelotrichaceae bacterium]MDY5252861.1 VanZ family protein [Erysipelotrichaceae bacterium]